MGRVEVAVYDIRGRKLDVLIDDVQEVGIHDVEWSAENYSSGVYVLALRTDGGSMYRKMLLVK